MTISPVTAPQPWQIPPVGRRVGARFLDMAFGLAYVLLVVLGFRVGPGGLLVADLVWGLLNLVVLLTVSATLGQVVLGLRNVEVTTGAPSGPRTLGKYVLMWFFSAISCGILLLIALLTLDQPLRRSWFDKWTGLVVVRRDPTPTAPQPTAAQPISAGAPNTAAPYYPEAGVGDATHIRDAISRADLQPQNASPAPTTVPVPAPTWAAPPSAPVEQPAAVAVPTPASSTTGPPAPGTLRLDTGQELRLDRTYVLGRDPVPPAGHQDAVPVAVVDEARSISKTHVLIGSGQAGLWVMDLHSTNGVSITVPGGQPIRVVAGARTDAPFGSTITYGRRTAEVIA